MSGAGLSWKVRAPLALAGLALGALGSLWGTSGSRADAGTMEDDAMLVMPASELCLPAETVSRAVEQGALVHERSCAGCHDSSARLIGPSYAQIVAAYRAQAGTGSVEGRILAGLARASAHPSAAPAWVAYGHVLSPPALSTDERNALAYWMFRGAPVSSSRTSPRTGAQP